MGQNAYQTAVETLARRRSHAEAQAARRREELYQSLPELRRFDARAAALCRQMTAAILEGEPSAEYQQALQSLQGERLAALQAAGVDEAQLRPRYTCPHCRDTGFVNGIRCSCLTTLLKEQALSALPAGVLAACGGFEGFDLTYYSDSAENGGRSPRDIMRTIAGRCREYAAGFGPGSGNLLFLGRTGLGKTYLSACIALEVASQGWRVQYYPAQALVDRFERVRFSRTADEADQEAVREILSCDLLVLDDLGAEFSTAFSQSVLYQVINDRMVEGRSTIISTNLDLSGLSKTYNERILSRLIGSYTMYGFVGRDIRQQKLVRSRQEAAL